jgi:hypothetical protein
MDLFVMDNDEQWHKVEETDSAIIGSIYERVAQLHKQYSIVPKRPNFFKRVLAYFFKRFSITGFPQITK